MRKRLLSIILALCMIVTMLPVITMAEETHTTIGTSGEIINFAPLTETEKKVSLGIAVEDLELPETVAAIVRAAMPIGSETETAEATTEWQENTVDIPVVWTSPEYDMDTEGEYVFTPMIEGYTINTPLPEITITVEMGIMARELATPLSYTTYNIWVGGVQVTDVNRDNISGTGIIGNISYDPATLTLTLNGATITAVYEETKINYRDENEEYQYGIYADIPDLKIVVTGDNKINCPDAIRKFSYGIYTKGVLGISGTGSLYSDSGKGSVSYGIYSNGELTIKSGTITGISDAIWTSLGIYGSKINIFGGDVNAHSIGHSAYSILANSYNITGGKITVTGKNGLAAIQKSYPINISGGEVNANVVENAIFGVLNFNGGMVIARGETNALNGTLNLIKGIAKASTSKDGSNAVTYDAANIENYKYIMVEPYKNGATIMTPATEASKSYHQITVNPALASENPGEQIIEYAISTSNSVEPTDGWQSDVLFTGLLPSTTYYVWARTAEKTGYNPGIPVASMGITTTAEPIKSVSVGSQSGTATAGKAGSLTYTVTTANIANGTYPVSVANLPSGVTVGNSGNVTISDNSGTLTLTVDNTAAAGTTSTLELTLNGTTSAPFTIAISEPVPVSYNIWVGGVQVKSANASNILGNGTVTYDSATSTLTLDGATITNNYSNGTGTYGIYANQSLKIVLVGDNWVTAANITEKESLAIRIVNNPLTIEGSGSLTAKAGNVSGTINYSSCGISANGLTINSGTVTAVGGTVPPGHTLSSGIYSSSTLKFNGGTITATGNNKSINKAPDLSDYTDLQVVASKYVSGTPVVTYKAADIGSYKYLRFDSRRDTTITNLDLTSKLTAPVTGGTPETSISDDQYTGTITWSDNPIIFLGSRVYTATLNLTAEDGYTFSGVAANAFSYQDASSLTNSIGSEKTLTVTIIFPETEARTLEKIIITTPPTKITYYYGETFDKTGMIVKASYDDGTRDENFTDYTVDRTEPLTLSDSLITLTANGTSIKTTQAITVIKKTPTIPTTPDLVYDSTAVDYDNSSHVIVTPPAADKPNDPTQGEIKVPGTADGKGNITVNITKKTVTDAFDKALTDAKKKGNEQNGITVVLRVDTGSKTGFNVTVNLPKTVQDTIIAKKIVNTIVVVDNPDIRIGMDLATVQEINKQAKSDVNITANRRDSDRLTGDGKKAIGTRPVFDLKVNYGSGKQVQRFGTGNVSVTIPYTLGINEKAGNVQAVYLDGNGKVHWLVNSVYDSVEKVLIFSTNHFSTYGVGYKEDAPAFTDIASHWAKEDIEFVVSNGLFSGTSATTFSPNTAMTRGMFVTALGRLANADVSGYTKSSFTDVKSDAYYMGYIEWASKNSIIKGTGNGRFAPDQSITREQMAVIMENYAKVIGFTLPKVHEENTFDDSTKVNVYAKDAVKQMQMAGIISGKNGNLFDPQGTATRGEVSAVLRRFVELMISSDSRISKMQ